jgi:hypothetical protein
MGDKKFVKNLRKEQTEIWLKFADNYLRNSGNEFLGRFSDFLKEGYRCSEKADYIFNKPSWATKQQIVLKDMLDFEAFKALSMQVKGCALIGGTNFDKLEFIKKYFEVRGLLEFTDNETAGHYAVVNCSDIKRHTDLIKSLVKNQNAAYVIFNNCDSLLKHDDAVQVFKHLTKDSIGITMITKDGESVNFKTDSSYIFLGEENTLHIAVEKQALNGNEVSAYNHFDAFIHFIRVYDFDKGERYFGHNVDQKKVI